MKAILSAGVLLALCDHPRYVRKNQESGAYVEATQEDAEAISVGGTLYNLPGHATIPDAPEAIVNDANDAEFIFQNRAHIVRVEETTGAAIVGVEEALCDIDAASESRVAALEEALCELDSAFDKGGEN